MLVSVNHIQVTIPKGEEQPAREFYCQGLGLQEIEKPDALKSGSGFWLVLGDIQIHIGTEDGVARSNTKAHIAYEVSDIDLWRRKLRAMNIQIIANKSIPGYERFELRDPFGNKIEIIGKVE